MRAILLVVLSGVLGLAPPARAAEPAATVRDVVTATAQVIRDEHYSVAVGARVAQALQADVWPDAQEPATSAFAERLTSRLRELSGDRHFRVSLDQPQADAARPSLSPHGIVAATLDGDGVATLRLDHFPPDDAVQRAAIDAALAPLASAKAWLIDVRENRGGDPAGVAYLLGHLFSRPAFVSMRFQHRGTVTWSSLVRSDGPGLHIAPTVPMAILISPHTFSGGEALAYELQAYGRALVAGERSGGAANATVMLPLPGDFAITVPHRQPRHVVTGTNWEGVGVRPDLAVPVTEAEARAREYLLAALRR